MQDGLLVAAGLPVLNVEPGQFSQRRPAVHEAALVAVNRYKSDFLQAGGTFVMQLPLQHPARFIQLFAINPPAAGIQHPDLLNIFYDKFILRVTLTDRLDEAQQRERLLSVNPL